MHQIQGCASPRKCILKQVFLKVLCNLNINSKQVKRSSKTSIVAVTLTGSDPAGRSVASIAGQNLKKDSYGLGSDAYLVLEDANLEKLLI
jgi:succinate-semialdehyde dehydrogenase/glutarate-semialdehyde dehydrogenase